MTPHTYSSITAFIAHWRTLAAAADAGPSRNEVELLRAMENALAPLRPDERAALIEPVGDRHGARARRAERAVLTLHRILAASGWLAG